MQIESRCVLGVCWLVALFLIGSRTTAEGQVLVRDMRKIDFSATTDRGPWTKSKTETTKPSVGVIAMGGSGKIPVTSWAAEIFTDALSKESQFSTIPQKAVTKHLKEQVGYPPPQGNQGKAQDLALSTYDAAVEVLWSSGWLHVYIVHAVSEKEALQEVLMVLVGNLPPSTDGSKQAAREVPPPEAVVPGLNKDMLAELLKPVISMVVESISNVLKANPEEVKKEK